MPQVSAQSRQLAIKKACRNLKAGELIAYPTEAVFGLGCDALNTRALKKLRAIKNRTRHKGFIVICSSVEQLKKSFPNINLTKQQWGQLTQKQNHPTTWLLPIEHNVKQSRNRYLIGNNITLAVRITEHPVAKALCESFDGPIVSSSANKAGARPAKKLIQVRKNFRNKIKNYVTGALGDSFEPSQIIDIKTGKVIRAVQQRP